VSPVLLPHVFVAEPALALLPAGLLGALYLFRPRRITLVAALAWLAYFPYEQAMKLRVLCSGECNIRADLVLAYPALLALTLAALFAALRPTRP
jgi:hypothetical protein